MPEMNPKKLYYLNPNIKKSNIIENFTEEQVLEYARCSEDPIYFIEKYVKIQHVDHGLVDFILRGYQKKLIKSYVENRNNIVLSSRQSGKTITTAAYLLWFVLFNAEKTVAILAHKAPVARAILSRIMKAYENIPFFLQPGCKTLNKGLVELGNGSNLVAEATTGDGIRSYSCVDIDSMVTVKIDGEIKTIRISELLKLMPEKPIRLNKEHETTIRIHLSDNGFNNK